MTNRKLAEFFAYSLELEGEAQERYGELADSMEAHHNLPVAQFFRRMETEASHHLEEVTELAADMKLPQLKAWEFNWPEAESPETASYEALHYRMSLRQAMSLALENERAAERYYRSVATGSDDDETVKVATRFADEELRHEAELQRLMKELPETSQYLQEEDDDPNMPE